MCVFVMFLDLVISIGYSLILWLPLSWICCAPSQWSLYHLIFSVTDCYLCPVNTPGRVHIWLKVFEPIDYDRLPSKAEHFWVCLELLLFWTSEIRLSTSYFILMPGVVMCSNPFRYKTSFYFFMFFILGWQQLTWLPQDCISEQLLLCHRLLSWLLNLLSYVCVYTY